MPPLNEIRDDLLDERVPLSAVLRRAYVLARSLDEPLFLGWIQNELNGYTLPEDPHSVGGVPDYRRPAGTLMGVGPFGMRKPLMLPTEEAMEKITRPTLVDPVARIEARAAGIPAGGTVHMTLHPHNETVVRGGFDYPIQPYLSYQRGTFVGILDAVRNKLLELTVDLQKRFPDLDLDRTTPEQRQEAAAIVLQVINNPTSCVITGSQLASLTWEQLEGAVRVEHRCATPRGPRPSQRYPWRPAAADWFRPSPIAIWPGELTVRRSPAWSTAGAVDSYAVFRRARSGTKWISSRWLSAALIRCSILSECPA